MCILYAWITKRTSERLIHLDIASSDHSDSQYVHRSLFQDDIIKNVPIYGYRWMDVLSDNHMLLRWADARLYIVRLFVHLSEVISRSILVAQCEDLTKGSNGFRNGDTPEAQLGSFNPSLINPNLTTPQLAISNICSRYVHSFLKEKLRESRVTTR
ncbi:hypothetical protein M422DRAFT_41486 [Sphaerobolus stellatus SS14]|nr:hypothetical protein M422DRAFT_41486 [Sphaerobolus stellatus SS14]